MHGGTEWTYCKKRIAKRKTEYTQASFDINLKMRVRLDKEAQYGVNMCWLCMPIRKGKIIWNTQDFPMKTKDEHGATIHVVSQTDGKYQVCSESIFSRIQVCSACAADIYLVFAGRLFQETK